MCSKLRAVLKTYTLLSSGFHSKDPVSKELIGAVTVMTPAMVKLLDIWTSEAVKRMVNTSHLSKRKPKGGFRAQLNALYFTLLYFMFLCLFLNIGKKFIFLICNHSPSTGNILFCYNKYYNSKH